ncbi:unnamed protein product [Triticum aestivum]|uniref:Uncharacterized protein n=5 Tax=Triticinae TaxID=1648030 RepID=A0A9R1JDI7_WHEAT|nr:UPF0307 protein IL0389 [Aegilops tauschii subsp. strangulata]XP_020185359.1 UPF0307 protein IL0389 [Aegilops tauschii subsp. strangulata]XP_044330013.1 UPF0307 protein IL0389-like [Triticum aestivum]XP_044330014.1 UPF0307 protein IL0389-like [Triticum aestivum]KAF7013541.1 hypothetical protein CFC21_027619 [Triticum aestivum]SPT15931.1 unnamed protein product [Triticum aestivum]
MAHAAAAAAVPLRRPLLLFLRPARLLSFVAPRSSSVRAYTRALRPLAPLPSDDEDPDDGDGAPSRNEKKREARRAVKWGMELAKFSPPQIKRIVRAASLEREVVDALMLVKKFGPDVREGRRRQYNYIGSLLRGAQPELMEDLIHSLKNGDESRIQALLSEVADKSMPIEDEEVGELPHEEEDEGNQEYMEIADRWFEGLVCQDIPVTNEVYAIHNVEFDRQELRKLVRIVQEVQKSMGNKDSGEGSDRKLSRAKKPLIMFLRSLAKKTLE